MVWGGALLLYSCSLWAVTNTVSHYTSRLWQNDDGLPHNSVQAITQTRDGYLWVGTDKGLARFNGLQFTVVPLVVRGKPMTLPVTALAETQDGSLWIGARDHGLFRIFRNTTSHFTKEDGLPSNSIRSLCAAKDGSLWIGTTLGLIRFQSGKLVAEPFVTNTKDIAIRALSEDEHRSLWIVSSVGLKRARDGVITNHHMTNGVAGPPRSAFRARNDALWVGATGVCRQDANGVVRYGRTNGLSDNYVSVMHQDSTGTIWVGTYSGLNWLSSGDTFVEIKHDGESFDLVNAIYEDREANLWIGAKEGLYRLKWNPFVTHMKQHGLLHNNVMSVLEDSQGTLWIGTWGGGLHVMTNGTISPFSTFPQFTSRSHLVLALHENVNFKNFWVGLDYTGGLVRFQSGKGFFYGPNRGLNDPTVRVVLEDRDRTVWIGTAGGLNKLEINKNCVRFSTDDGLAGNDIRVLCEDEEKLWIGTLGGLTLHREGKFKTLTNLNGLSGSAINALYRDREGVLWVGTRGGGLGKMKSIEGAKGGVESVPAVSHFTTRNGLASDDVFEIVEDDDGFLWTTSGNGVSRVKKQDFADLEAGKIGRITSTLFGKDDGLASAVCNSVAKPSAWRGRDGKIWFATAKGLAVVDPRHVQKNVLPPPVMVEDIIADKKIVNPSGAQDQVIIAPGRGELEIHFAGLSFTASEKNRFKYKLEGSDHDWIDAGTRRVAYYNNLPPGDYAFHITACNNDGIWNSAGSSVRLRLLPHFWQTWWFKSFGIAACLSVVAGTARYATKRRMQIKLERLEQQHAIERERTRIAQDMHDDLGARLTEVLLLSDLAKRNKEEGRDPVVEIDKVSHAVRDISRNLNALVWAVNPKNDRIDELVTYISKYAERFLSTTTIRFRLDAPLELPAFTLSAEARHNVFLVLKEALNNVVKHAAASEVWFRVHYEKELLTLRMEDNGKGFKASGGSEAGNGLGNMARRMQATGGTFAWQSEPGKGTRIEIQIPLGS